MQKSVLDALGNNACIWQACTQLVGTYMLAKFPVSQVEALSAALEEERRLGRARDARHKLTVERLRRHNLQLQVCTTCLPKPQTAPKLNEPSLRTSCGKCDTVRNLSNGLKCS